VAYNRLMAAQALLEDLMPNEPWQGQDMINTAGRWCRMMEMMSRTDAPDFEFTTFKNPGHDELVIEKDILFSSLCSHHLLPFFGTAHVGYIPQARLAGLSKLPRLVHWMSKGTWTQEGLTQAIANYLEAELQPLGVAVIMLDVTHTCMTIRGVKERTSTTTTSAMKGVFANHDRLARGEFLSLLAL
jgi:GTP cyclohydrolase I